MQLKQRSARVVVHVGKVPSVLPPVSVRVVHARQDGADIYVHCADRAAGQQGRLLVVNVRTLRLFCNNVAKESVRTGNVTGRCSDCVVTLIYYLYVVILLRIGQLTKQNEILFYSI